MSRALLLSQHFPVDDKRLAIGVFRRLELFVRALTQAVDEVTCLFVVPENQARSAAELRAREAQLRQRWSPKISLQVSATGVAHQRGGWSAYTRGILDFAALDMVAPFSAPRTIADIGAALETRPDILFVQRLGLMGTLMRVPQSLRTMPIEFDLDDVEHIAMYRRLLRNPDWPRERLKLLQLPALILGERKALQLATTTFVCSENDRQHVETYLGASSVRVVRNAVPMPDVLAHSPSEPVVMFVGSFGYPPNAQAAQTLITKIWPRIRTVVPEAQLVIVGNRPERLNLSAEQMPGVSLAGFVEDLAAVYRRARVVCCPIFVGSGTRVKIIEAAGFGKAIVSTRLGAEGIDLAEGSEILLEDDLDAMAAACIRLLQDTTLADDIGRRARVRAESLYDLDTISTDLARHFASVIRDRRDSERNRPTLPRSS